MNRKGVLEELSGASKTISIIEASARTEGLNGLAEGLSTIREDIKDWCNKIEEASLITFPKELQ